MVCMRVIPCAEAEAAALAEAAGAVPPWGDDMTASRVALERWVSRSVRYKHLDLNMYMYVHIHA